MHMWRMVALALTVATPSAAHDWERQDGGHIFDLLAGHGVVLDGTVQRFERSGVTTLSGDVARSGLWKVERNRFCTDLVPGGWSCFTVEAVHGELIRLVGANGSVIEGALIP